MLLLCQGAGAGFLHMNGRIVAQRVCFGNNMNIFGEVRALNLPLGKYLVVGSGILAALGIRESKDIDLLVSEDIYEKYEKLGWKKKQVDTDRFGLTNGHVELFKDFRCGKYCPDPKQMIDNPTIIEDIPFLPLEELAKFKKELGREKDLKDLELIEEYLNQTV